ncbi:WG repeat-containing protein [Ohtaekwangia kribbensis]|uniref:WG repeat-containing protein n=1 Tax=Ohtaekwangia kribbensis TaxID=688913 RepID=A0ABW3K275_9BACT
MKTTVILRGVCLLFFVLYVHNVSAQLSLRPASVHPNAIVINGKSSSVILNEFKEGVAVIIDGSTAGLIDATGKFIIPFGKYNTIGSYQNGFAIVTDKTNHNAVIDKSGNIVLRGIANPAFDKSGYFLMDTYTIINLKGQTFKLNYAEDGHSIYYQNFSEGLCSFLSGKASKHGYIDRTGKVVISPQFTRVTDFSEGLAAVAKENEVGEERWGYIDQTGKVVIPLQYKNQPGPFSNGLAHLISSTFGEHAWIDKSGQVKIKLNPSDNYYIENKKDFDFTIPVIFLKGKSKSRALLDVNGNIKPITISYDVVNYNRTSSQKNSGEFECIGRKDNQIMIQSHNGFGLIDEQGKLLVAPIFDELSFLDPIAKLAKARFYDGKKHIEGYINDQGVFVILKGEVSRY